MTTIKKTSKDSVATSVNSTVKNKYEILPLDEDFVMVTFYELLDKNKSKKISEYIHKIKQDTQVLGSVEAGKIKGFIVQQPTLDRIRKFYEAVK